MGFMVHFLLGLVLFSSTCWLLEGAESHQQVQQNDDDKLVSQQNAHINENEKKTEDEEKFLGNVNRVVQDEDRIETNKKTVVSTEKNNNVNKKSNNSSSINSSIIKLQHTEPYSKEDSREDVGRSIDIDKYVSEDFHNKNNVYTVPVSSDTEKFINPDYDYISSSSHHYHDQATSFSFSSELTTPISSIFDNRYKETVKNVDQTLEHIPDHLDDSDTESKEIDVDKLYEATQNGTQANLDYANFKNIIKNDTDRKNAIHKDLTVESGSNLNFVSSYNKTDVVDESSNYSFPSNSTEKPEIKTEKPLVLTTRKNTVLTKPPSNRNVSHILSNKIETESVKSPTTPRLYTRTTPLDKRGSVKFADYIKSSTPPSKKLNKSEQLVQENQIIPVHIEAPLPETTTIAAATTEYQLTTVEDTTIDLTTTPTTTTTTTTDATATSFTTTDTTTTSIPTTDTTTTAATTEVTTVAEEPTTESQFTTESISTTTDVTTLANTEQTLGTETTTNVAVETTTLSSTTTESATTTLPSTTTESATTTTENTATEATTTSTFEMTTAIIPDVTTDTIIRTSKGVDFDKTTTEAMETTTETSKETTTAEASVSSIAEFPVNKTVEIRRGPDVSTTTTTEIVFVHIENNQTTLLPETLNPEYNYPTPDRGDMVGNSTPTSSENGGLKDGGDGSEDNSGTIAAIAISSVGAVCLILLAGLLFIMKKRQKRFNYGQRCTPVSLDDYSMDNVSVYNSVRRKAALRSSKRSYGNPAFDDPVCVSHPLKFPALGKFANNTEELKTEFEEIPQIHARTNELPEGCDSKNRYANVIPLPETRVFLTLIDGYPNSDYINANYVTGPKNTKGYYIAAQAPLQNTVDDFWRMIWEQNSKVILMLTHLFENGVEKCVDYLPPSEVLDCHRLFGDFQITLKKREVKDKYVISTVQLKNMVSNSWREVTHFWYLGWPEKGVPTEANSMIAFLIEARSYMKSSVDKNKEQNGSLSNGKAKNELNPVVVHCSPGTGRTGVVIACDICIREFEQDRIIDIPRIVYRIRRDRASAVQTKEQYAFIYKVVNLYATKLAGGALDSI